MTRIEILIYILALLTFTTMTFLTFFSPLSLRLDEAQSLWQTSHSIEALLNSLSMNVHVPLYHVALHFWQMLFGNSELTVRTFSFAAFIASIPAVYFLGRLAYNRTVALFAATLLALSPFMNWFGSETRMYSLLVLISILSHYFFIKLMRGYSFPLWLGYTLVAVIGVYTHYFFALLLLAQGLFYLAYRHEFPQGTFRALASTAAVVFASFLPWALKVLDTGGFSETEPLLSRPGTVDFFNVFSNFFFGFQTDYVNSLLLSLWPLIVLLGFLALRNTMTPARETMYFFATVAVPIALALAASLTLQPVFLSRYLIVTLPGLIVLTSALSTLYPRLVGAGARIVLVLLMVVALSFQSLNPTIAAKEDYRAAAAFLEQNARPQDIIVVSAPFTIYPLYYYYGGSARITTIPDWDRFDSSPIQEFSQEEIARRADDFKETYQRVWVLLSYDQGYETAIKDYFDGNYERLVSEQISDGIELYAYKLRYDVDYAENLIPATGTSTQRSVQGQ